MQSLSQAQLQTALSLGAVRSVQIQPEGAQFAVRLLTRTGDAVLVQARKPEPRLFGSLDSAVRLLRKLGVTAIMAWMTLLPPELRMFGLSAAATALSVSNIYFFRNTDYFAAPAEGTPLIHTWSLGIEEQFYLLFPSLAVALGLRRSALPILLLLTGASLAAAQWSAMAYPAAAFYLLPTRAWELLAGAILAYRAPAFLGLARAVREAMGLAGLLALVAAYAFYDRQTPFPGFAALLPVAGTGLIIASASPDTWVGRGLAWRPLVVVGLTSYSTYLWHQPLFAFARHLWLSEPPAHVMGALSIAAFVIGALSWRFVERPFRDRSRVTRARVFTLAAACTALTIGFSAAALLSNGFRSTFDGDVLAFLEPQSTWSADPCHHFELGGRALSGSCILGDARNVVGALIGDSHAASIAQELGSALAKEGLGVLQITFNGCPPLPDVFRADMGLAYPCPEFHAQTQAFLETSPALAHVIIVSRWTRIVSNAPFDNTEGGIEHSPDRLEHLQHGRPWPLRAEDRAALITQKLSATVRHLLDLGKGVIIAYPIPEVGWDAPRYLARREMLRQRRGGEDATGSTSLAVFAERNKATFAMLDSLGTHPRLSRVYPHQAFCDRPLPGRCVFQRGHASLYTDDNHVSLDGARLLVPEIVAALRRQVRPGP